MGAYKKLNKQDAYITTYAAHKNWVVTGSAFTSYGITGAIAGSGYTLQSLQQLYYVPKISSGNTISHSFDLYNQTTLFYSSSRVLTTGSRVISIPREMYGTNIKPGTFKLSFINTVAISWIEFDFVTQGFLQETPTVYLNRPDGTEIALRPPFNPVTLVSTRYTFIDDAEGGLFVSGGSAARVGDIIYTHGMAIITNPQYHQVINGVLGNPASVTNTAALRTVTMSFQNTQPIFTHNYHCKIRESEFNYTYNPSAVSSSLQTVYSNLGYAEGYYEYNYSTGDYDTFAPTISSVSDGVINSNLRVSGFQPYITTVGLYNDANQLIAVGKMPRPVPKSANTEMTIIVKIDI